MTYKTFQQYNQTDLAGLFTYPAEVVPVFAPLLLFALFMIALLGTYYSQKRLTGRGDFFSSFAVAGYFTAVIAIVMSLVDGLINTSVVVTAIVVAVIGTIFLFTGHDR